MGMFELEQTRGRPDFLLLFMTLALAGFGIVMVFSSSYILAYYDPKYNDSLYFVKKQLVWVSLGFVAMVVVMNIPYRFYRNHFPLLAIASFLLLFLVYTPLGIKLNGARSWIGLGPLALQPAEFAKLGLVIYLAGLIAKKGDKFRILTYGLVPALVVTFTFFISVLGQPDFGTSVILLLTAGVVIFSGGANLKHLLVICIPAVAALGVFVISAPYRIARITTFMNPWNDGMNGLGSGYQLAQSLYAIGHGQMNGVGFGKSIQKFMYLPYPQTDFIFAVMAEELGFIGSTLFLLFFILFLWRIIHVTLRCPDPFCNLVGIGVVSMIAIQSLINIGGVTGTIPITGVPLPFISYGGSSLLVCMLSMGVILSISREGSRLKADRKQSLTI
jgi:cell division protein FtsW